MWLCFEHIPKTSCVVGRPTLMQARGKNAHSAFLTAVATKSCNAEQVVQQDCACDDERLPSLQAIDTGKDVDTVCAENCQRNNVALQNAKRCGTVNKQASVTACES